MSNQATAMNRLNNIQRALGSSALSGNNIESDKGKSTLANLLVQATAADFDPEAARQSVIKGLGLAAK